MKNLLKLEYLSVLTIEIQGIILSRSVKEDRVIIVLSTELSPNFNMTAENTFVLQYQKLGMIQCLKLRDFCSKSTGKPL